MEALGIRGGGPAARILRPQGPEPTSDTPQPLPTPQQPQAEAVPANGGSYISPVIRLDQASQQAVLQFRDATSGEVTRQYPSERQLRAYASSAQAPSPTAAGATTTPAEATTASETATAAGVTAAGVTAAGVTALARAPVATGGPTAEGAAPPPTGLLGADQPTSPGGYLPLSLSA